MSDQQINEMVNVQNRDPTDLPISIPLLIFFSEKPGRVQRLILIYEKRGKEKEMNFLERVERLREYWDQHHRVPKYGWDEHGYVLKQ